MSDIYELRALKIIERCREAWKARPGRRSGTYYDSLLLEAFAKELREAADPSLLEAAEDEG